MNSKRDFQGEFMISEHDLRPNLATFPHHDSNIVHN
jgi:hypothetical protein